MELGDTTKAMSFYKSAATDYVNDITTPYFMMKQARIHELKKEFTLSLEIYNAIKSDYPESKEGTNIDIVDGFKLFKGSTIYGTAKDVNEIIYWGVDGYYDIDSYMVNGWAPTARACDVFGFGITSPALLGRDVQIRFTGVYGAPIPLAGGGVYIPVESGGSMAWIDGARVGDFASHPENPNPGSTDPFHIRIPFEVWDL